MSIAEALINADNWIVLVTFWVSVLFVPAVSTFWPWWKEPFGRATVSIEGLIGVALLPGALHQMFGVAVTSLFFLWFGTIVLALIAPRLIWLFITIYRLQRREALNGTENGVPEVADRS